MAGFEIDDDDLQKVADLIYAAGEERSRTIKAGIFFDECGHARIRIAGGVDHAMIRRMLHDLADDYWHDARHMPDQRLN